MKTEGSSLRKSCKQTQELNLNAVSMLGVIVWNYKKKKRVKDCWMKASVAKKEHGSDSFLFVNAAEREAWDFLCAFDSFSAQRERLYSCSAFLFLV